MLVDYLRYDAHNGLTGNRYTPSDPVGCAVGSGFSALVNKTRVEQPGKRYEGHCRHPHEKIEGDGDWHGDLDATVSEDKNACLPCEVDGGGDEEPPIA